MVDTAIVTSFNGDTRELEDDTAARRRPELPEYVTVTLAEMQQFPSPGTQRALKAETGVDYLAMVGPNADSADRTQTQIWVHLRKRIPNLRWEDCAEISMEIAGADAGAVDPTLLAGSVLSPASADSGD